METTNVRVLLTFLVLLIPFGVLCWLFFLPFKHKIKTVLNYFVLAFFIMFLALIYFSTIYFATDLLLSGNIKHLINATCYGAIMWACNIVVPIAVVTIILTVIWAYKTRAVSGSKKT